jgi:hypothetical protein
MVVSSWAQDTMLNTSGKTVKDRFSAPEGYIRVPLVQQSFGEYLRSFLLKAHQTPVYLFDNSLKANQDVHTAVLDIDRGSRDLQQCADAVMRLRAEFLYKYKRISEIHFKNYSGTDMDYSRYMQGYRINSKGFYLKSVQPDNTAAGFRKYLDMVFAYANTYTLEKELKPISLKDIQAGDVFIVSYPTRFGHAVMVMDVAENKQTGDKVFLLAQSYMPAQDIHILKNSNDSKNPYWYSLSQIKDELHTPERTFPVTSLHRFY